MLIPTGAGAAKKIPIEGIEPQQALLLPNDKGFLVIGKGKGESILHMFLIGPGGGKPRLVRGAEGITPGYRGQPWVASPDGERFAYLANDRQLRVGSVSSGEMSTIPGAPLEENDIPAQWSADGRFLFVLRTGHYGLPAQFDRLELATGRREPWKKLRPADPTGVVQRIGGSFAISRDGLSYAYSYNRVLDVGPVRRGRSQVAEPLRRHPPRPLRDPRAAGRGRDGGGVPGAGHAPGARGGDQGAAGVAGLGCRSG